MPNGSQALDFEAVLKTTDFKTEIADLERRLRGFTVSAASETSKIDQSFAKLGKSIGGYLVFSEFKTLATDIVRVRGEFQNLEIAFTTMLKSKAKSDKLLAEITQYAATTPFTLTDLGKGAKQLLAYGTNVNNIVSEIKTLGDVASGTSIPINDLIYLYGTLRTQGRAYSVDIRQFAGRGIPIYEELAKVLKINVGEVNNFVEAGKVGFKEVEQAFKNMTQNGGIFEGLTEKAGKSVTGLASNFTDAVDRMYNKIGQSQEGLIVDSILTATKFVENYEDILDVLKVIIATYGAYRAALIVTTALQGASALGSAVTAWISLARGIKSAADAQALFNLTSKANPWGLAIAGIAALVSYLYVYSDETEKIVDSSQLLANINKDVTVSVQKQKTEIGNLIAVLKNQNVADSARLAAYNKLNEISPKILNNLDFQKAKTTDLTKTTNDYIVSLEEKIRLEATQDQATKLIKDKIQLETDLKTAIQKRNEIANSAVPITQTGLDARGGGVGRALDLANAQKNVEALTQKYNTSQKTVTDFNKTVQETFVKANTAAVELPKIVEKGKGKTGEKVYPFGSLDYWESIAKKADDIINSTPSTNLSKIDEQNKIKLNAIKQAEAVRLLTEQRAFDDEIEYKKKQYELYLAWVKFEGETAANAQFADLLKSGDSYKTYLEKQINDLQTKIDNGTATGDDKKNIVTAKVALEVSSESLEIYKQKITDAKDEVSTLTEYLSILNQEQQKLGKGDVEKTKFIAQEIINAERGRKNLIKDFFIESNTDNAQRIAIQKKYKDLRTELDAQYLDKKNNTYQQGLSKINEAEKTALAEQAAEELSTNSAVYKELTAIVKGENRKQLIDYIESLKTRLDLLSKSGGIESKLYKELTVELATANKELVSKDIESYNELINIVGQIGSEFSNIDGTIGDIGKSLSFVASQSKIIRELAKSDGGKDSVKANLTNVASFASTIIGGIIRAFADQKRLKDELYTSIIGQQTQYNNLLTEQIRLNSIINQNSFTKNYEGIVNDAQKSINLASNSLDKLIAKIQKSAGAIIGKEASFLGVGGGDVLAPTVLVYKDLIDQYGKLNLERAKALIDNNLVDKKTAQLLQDALDTQKLIDDAQKQIKDVISELSGQLGSTLRDNIVTAFKDGTDAAKAFGDTVGGVLENIISQTLFSSVFGQAFDKLQKDFEASFSSTGDGVLTDDLVKFYKDYPDLIKVFTDGLTEAQKEAEKAGLDIFKNSSSSSSGLSGAVKGITEESAGIIAGQLNAFRINQAIMVRLTTESLAYLSNISEKSTVYLPYLKSIDAKLTTADNLRATGLG